MNMTDQQPSEKKNFTAISARGSHALRLERPVLTWAGRAVSTALPLVIRFFTHVFYSSRKSRMCNHCEHLL